MCVGSSTGRRDCPLTLGAPDEIPYPVCKDLARAMVREFSGAAEFWREDCLEVTKKLSGINGVVIACDSRHLGDSLGG